MAILTMVVAGCATTMTVSSHVQRGLDFAQYTTYDWGPADALPTGDPRLDKDPFFQDHMQGAVEKRLAMKGFKRLFSGRPDLLIHYHASINERIHVDPFDRGSSSCDSPECVSVVEFEAGTLVLDIVDTRADRVIWRGWAQQALGDMLDNRERMARTIDEAVGRMLDRLPSPVLLTSQQVPAHTGGK
jgi:hypothetical protein